MNDYWADKEKEIKRQERQIFAYDHRNDIKVGDRFVWKIGDCKENRSKDSDAFGYLTSGRLKQKYMPVHKSGKYWGNQILTVCAVHEGHNGYGPFVDYWLSPSGKIEKDFVGDKIYNGCLVINGPDARKMERVKEESGEKRN